MNKGLEKGGREIQTTFRFQFYMELEWNLEPDPISLKSVFIFRGIHPNKAEFHSCLVFKNGLILPTVVINDAWYCMVLHGIARYCMVLHGIAWYCMVLYGIAW